MWDKPGVALDFANTPEATVITERDFVFTPGPVDDLMYQPTLTAIFVARCPRAANEIPDANAPLTMVDDSYTLPVDQPEARRAKAQQLVERTQAIHQLLAPLLDPADNHVQATHEDERMALLDTIRSLEARLTDQEQQIREKNTHITSLEGLIRRIEAGWAIRMLRALRRVRG
jgi:hypothetical protein